jgi:hypothetical protein
LLFKVGHVCPARAEYFETMYWTASELRRPPRTFGKNIRVLGDNSSRTHSARMQTVVFASGVQRSFRPLP